MRTITRLCFTVAGSMAISVAGLAVSFMLFLIRDLDNPFQGDWHVSPALILAAAGQTFKNNRSRHFENDSLNHRWTRMNTDWLLIFICVNLCLSVVACAGFVLRRERLRDT